MNKLICALVLAGSLASASTPPVTPSSVATVQPPQGAVQAPQGTFGVKFCTQIVLWVVLQDGKVIRIDKNNHPKTPEEMQKFLEWLDTGPEDIQVLPCPVSA